MKFSIRETLNRAHKKGIPFLDALRDVREEKRVESGLLECEICQAWVSPKRMQRHLRRAHRVRQGP
mgnify:CR=1 FL=1